MVERIGEPLSALFLPAAQYPDTLLAVAWRHLVLDSAHDSSCACSHDEVVEAVRVRYQEARHIGEALAHDALRMLATEVDAPPGSTIVVNPTQPRGAGSWRSRFPARARCTWSRSTAHRVRRK